MGARETPSWYGGGVECIAAMRAAMGDEAVKDFCAGNVFKYVWRLGKKDSAACDMVKIRDYAQMWLDIHFDRSGDGENS